MWSGRGEDIKDNAQQDGEVVPTVEVGGTRTAASGEDQESLGYAEMPLRSGDIQWELARWLDGWLGEKQAQESKRERIQTRQ